MFTGRYGLIIYNFGWPGIDYALVVNHRRDSSPRLSDLLSVSQSVSRNATLTLKFKWNFHFEEVLLSHVD